MLLCFVPHRLNRDLEVSQMERVASFVAQVALRHESLLLHGALAEYRGSGFIMAGPGTVGKSTASRRLPPSWHSLSDDATLVVRDGVGQCWAHPWPTWSRFHGVGSGGSWPVEHAVPLRAVFFLSQSRSDRLEPVNTTQATALLVESAVNLTPAASSPIPSSRPSVHVGIHAAKTLALAVPAYSLQLSLDGRFWEEIERVLPSTGDRGPMTGRGLPSSVSHPSSPVTRSLPDSTPRSLDPSPSSASTSRLPPEVQEPPDGSSLEHFRVADGALRVLYVGADMEPTLVAPEFIEVKPYCVERVRPGDVVCFNSPRWRTAGPLAATSTMVAHRVTSVVRRETEDGGRKDEIRTRGDGNSSDDPWVLQAEDIIGRVKAAQRGARSRAIPGGRIGLMVARSARLSKSIRRIAGLLAIGLQDLVAGPGPYDHVLPRCLRPRLVRFDARCRVFLKLLSGRRTVAQYNVLRQRWHTQWPFRLFVDERLLRRAGSLVSEGKLGHVARGGAPCSGIPEVTEHQ